jgi:hypothetical protein
VQETIQPENDEEKPQQHTDDNDDVFHNFDY